MAHKSEVTELSNSRPVEVEKSSDRAAAFVRLADQHLDASYRLARAILRDPTDAEDATHDAILQAFQKWPSLRDPGKFEQWFDRILVNTCRNRLQRASRWRPGDISHEIAPAGRDQFAQTDDRDALGIAIAALSPEHRVVVALRYYRDLTIDDIADRLQIPPGTVQSRLHYALKKLHAAIDGADVKGIAR